ncbi:SDR family oxidoreductase [Polynucleobacter paneuropaeus]|nr:SDR family oxidoreductase [Polynucleobacter paneuropaeus]
MKILILGANGLIGHTIFRYLRKMTAFNVYGTIRNSNLRSYFELSDQEDIFSDIECRNFDSLAPIFSLIKPNIVINCAGITKHKFSSENPLIAIPINSLLPHQLAEYCRLIDARLIHISSDCVFSGHKGGYSEVDSPDALDFYGRSKALGEVDGVNNAITLRTSTIGHELGTSYGLLEWFLSQGSSCKGFNRAIFSGLPTIELARVIADYVIPNKDLYGLYNVAGIPITKFELLKILSLEYNKPIDIDLDNDFSIDRSLNSSKFERETGYKPSQWESLVKAMKGFK